MPRVENFLNKMESSAVKAGTKALNKAIDKGTEKLMNAGAGILSNINLGRKTSELDYNGNLLKTQWEGQNEYPNYLQNLMDREFIQRETESTRTREDIAIGKLKYYQDWRAILRIAPITNIKYAERNYAMFGRGGARTGEAEAGASVTPGGEVIDTNSGFLRVLTEVGGILFPYTPLINVSGRSNWQKQQLVHTNINYYSWENSEPESYDITGDFTASNPSEALYCLAIFNFLRTITKGSGPAYGEARVQEDKNLNRYNDNSLFSGMAREVPGAAPPVLYFSAYGNGMIDNVPVVVESYTYSLNKDVDYIELVLDPKNNWSPILNQSDRFNNSEGNLHEMVISRVPTKFSLSLKLLTNINPAKYRKFSLWDYKNGYYIRPLVNKQVNTGWTW